jgi:hypothetical protein
MGRYLRDNQTLSRASTLEAISRAVFKESITAKQRELICSTISAWDSAEQDVAILSPAPDAVCPRCPPNNTSVFQNDQYEWICGKCASVIGSNHVKDVVAFQCISETTQDHYGGGSVKSDTIIQRCADKCTQAISRVAQAIRLAEVITNNAKADCYLYVHAHGNIASSVKLKTVVAASLVRAQLTIYAREYDIDPTTGRFERRRYDGLDIPLPLPCISALGERKRHFGDDARNHITKKPKPGQL